jgi:hypothetical protein
LKPKIDYGEACKWKSQSVEKGFFQCELKGLVYYTDCVGCAFNNVDLDAVRARWK